MINLQLLECAAFGYVYKLEYSCTTPIILLSDACSEFYTLYLEVDIILLFPVRVKYYNCEVHLVLVD